VVGRRDHRFKGALEEDEEEQEGWGRWVCWRLWWIGGLSYIVHFIKISTIIFGIEERKRANTDLLLKSV
jgi:hypothetical protein